MGHDNVKLIKTFADAKQKEIQLLNVHKEDFLVPVFIPMKVLVN